jgi:hypothetical protein
MAFFCLVGLDTIPRVEIGGIEGMLVISRASEHLFDADHQGNMPSQRPSSSIGATNQAGGQRFFHAQSWHVVLYPEELSIGIHL